MATKRRRLSAGFASAVERTTGRMPPMSAHPEAKEMRGVLARDCSEFIGRQTAVAKECQVPARMAQREVAAEEHAARPDAVYDEPQRAGIVEPGHGGSVHEGVTRPEDGTHLRHVPVERQAAAEMGEDERDPVVALPKLPDGLDRPALLAGIAMTDRLARVQQHG